MAHLYKVCEWQGGSGHWYVNDVTDLARPSAKWWAPARMLNMSLTDYVIMLKDKFNATIGGYYSSTDVLVFYWNNYNDAHKYVLWVNKIARQKKYVV